MSNKLSNDAVYGNLIVGSGVKITGKINAPDQVKLSGEIEGDLETNHLTINETGQLSGSAKINDGVIAGRIGKNITSTSSLKIRSTATVSGEIKYQLIEIESGANIEAKLTKKTIKHNR